MLIDPFVVVAQIINFGLLVWLLRRFLFGPVTRAMRLREERIRAETEEARRLHNAAESEGKRYRQLSADFESERETRLAERRAELEALRLEQIRTTRAEVEAMRERWRHALEQEQAELFGDLRRRVGHESLAVMRRVMRDLADVEIEDRMVARFVERLGTLDPDAREQLQQAAHAARARGLLLRTAFPLSDARQASVRQAISAVTASESSIRFETDHELVAGIELRAGGIKLAWSLDDYLQSLEAALREVAMPTAGPDRAAT